MQEAASGWLFHMTDSYQVLEEGTETADVSETQPEAREHRLRKNC